MKKFSNCHSRRSANSKRRRVIIEKKFAYDGRPVSKVKTPYGTYCVRHPKAGEKLELSPPPTSSQLVATYKTIKNLISINTDHEIFDRHTVFLS